MNQTIDYRTKERQTLKNLRRDIERYKNALVRKAKKHGLWENFGQEYVRKLADKYSWDCDLSYDANQTIMNAKRSFSDWCNTCTLATLRNI